MFLATGLMSAKMLRLDLPKPAPAPERREGGAKEGEITFPRLDKTTVLAQSLEKEVFTGVCVCVCVKIYQVNSNILFGTYL